MTTKDEALQMALDALEFSKSYLDDLADVHGTSKKAKPGSTSWHVDRAIAACREAMAQKDEQEPVAWAVMQNGEICWDADYPFSNELADYIEKLHKQMKEKKCK